ncbi:hypothetical protein AB4Z46_07980 [Variovorax sp. M-6]|uniref:hypothetical protein n=1 Tax=Variovorax sp. M-6 TaxID=3233041 RepID=UPI003F9E8C1E
MDDILAKARSAPAAEKVLAGKPVSLLLQHTLSNDKDDTNTFVSSSRQDPSTVYSCDSWSKGFEQAGWVNGTVSRVTPRTKTDAYRHLKIYLTGCTAGTAPASDLSIVPMKALELEGLVKANALAERKNGYYQGGDGGTAKSKRQLEDKLVALKVVKHYKASLPTTWAFEASKARKDFAVVYNCARFDKSFKVGATVYGNVEDLHLGMDDEDVGVVLSNCRTKR